uniref:Uncharacterized protein n=1 Tax=Kalanchoe fedtschenkoi TaxID=63787 RepID=A0A7N0UPQ3_KALFE
MAQTLENIKGGGGSIKVGAVGTIGNLMTRELESAKSTPQTQSVSRSRLQTAPVSVPCGATPRRLQARRSLDEASSSGNGKKVNSPSPEAPKRSKGYTGSSRQVPMLGSDNISLDRTPSRENSIKKGPHLVDIVDVKCGDPHKSWMNPVANRLKKLGFAKLSETIG